MIKRNIQARPDFCKIVIITCGIRLIITREIEETERKIQGETDRESYYKTYVEWFLGYVLDNR